MYTLPWWMLWLQAIGVFALSLVGAWIAFKQVRIAAAKLNFDLYGKRFAIYEAARTYIGQFETEGQASLKEVVALRIASAESVFLFDASVKAYLDSLGTLGVRHEALRKKLDWPALDDSARGATADELADIENKMTTENARLIATFKPYLSLTRI
ncbi:hypothetical protein [Bradyrhizobium sp. AUGA SZCCT0283]|uniref:hypothetical protein n=1 Tax=Bradyrhizobium sp. AUGA SZCCT0283 TaxID=2807671 RepID=UPI001BA6A2B1|nr:hypothetical protein [Bradyrhizobium sp. AUGA SZCCT0283]MBR1279865.1 hypothetical protein [Bradyrhizobium sp. AUGA SZCCT0283]